MEQKMEFRLLDTGKNTAAMNMAIDEAIMQSRTPTLRFYSWQPSAVTIGYFQGIEQEVDLDACKKDQIDVVRRMTGGGAVFHDKEITYSLIIDDESKEVSRKILESYAQVCEFIVRGLGEFGLSAKFKPINDITINGKKVSGNAQTRKDGMILQHGTILLNVDVAKMFSLLRVPDEKIRDKMIATVKDRVTSVSDELGRQVGYDEARDVLITAFSQESHMRVLKPGKLSILEHNLARELSESKYGSREWNFLR